MQDELNEAAEAFASEYAGVTDEKGEAQNFTRDLCKVYKLNSRHAARFEHRVKGYQGHDLQSLLVRLLFCMFYFLCGKLTFSYPRYFTQPLKKGSRRSLFLIWFRFTTA